MSEREAFEKRLRRDWDGADPHAMSKQSRAAIFYAFDDLLHDFRILQAALSTSADADHVQIQVDGGGSVYPDKEGGCNIPVFIPGNNWTVVESDILEWLITPWKPKVATGRMLNATKE